MTAPAIVSNDLIASVPFYVRKLVVTSGNTATALTHSGPATPPDLYWAVRNATNPTGTEVALYSPTSTTITVDCEDDAAASGVVIFLLWFDAAAGGIS